MTKIGEGHAAAMARLGLRELRGAMYPESNVAQQPEYGLWGTQTPGEVAAARREGSLDLEQESILASRLEAAKDYESPGEDRPGPEMDR